MDKTNNPLLSRNECSAMRAIAILGIMLHNYCHWLPGIVRENEYRCIEANSSRMTQILCSPDHTLPVQLLSYLGHYGVPVFLFLSGFGLVMKYERRPHPAAPGDTAGSFIIHHYRKLFAMMITGLAAFITVDAITPGAHHFTADNIIAQMLMYINLLPSPDHAIWPGPYWFFGLMMQFYIIWRLLIYRRHSAVCLALIAACWLMQALSAPDGDTINRLRYNSIGGMLPFCLGVLTARTAAVGTAITTRRLPQAALAIALTLLTICAGLHFHTWLWAPFLVVTATVAAVKALPPSLLSPLVWTGRLSAVIFVIHPIFRKIFIPVSQHGDLYGGLLLYTIATITTAWMIRQCITAIKAARQSGTPANT